MTEDLIAAIDPLARVHDVVFVVLGNKRGRLGILRRTIPWTPGHIAEVDAALQRGMLAVGVVCCDLEPFIVGAAPLPDYEGKEWISGVLAVAEDFVTDLLTKPPNPQQAT